MTEEKTPVIEAEGLSVLRGGRRVLDGVRFEAREGEVTAILGPNGAGKSTLLLALAGLVPPERGTVRLGGEDLRAIPPRERAKRLAYVPQRTLLGTGLRVATVVAHGRYAHTGGLGRPGPADLRAIERAMSTTHLEALAARRFDRLSMGEQRRVLLARALATEAKTILLDEPTEALDVRHALELHGLLRELADEGYALVAVLHGLDAARRFTDRALLLDEGRVVAEGLTRDVVVEESIRAVYGVELVENDALGFRLESGS